MVCANHENILTTKISRSTVYFSITFILLWHSKSEGVLGTHFSLMHGSPGFTGQLGKSLILLNLLSDACHQVLYFFNQKAWLLLVFFFAARFLAALIQGQRLFFLSEAHKH